jgi:hypothetical protein
MGSKSRHPDRNFKIEIIYIYIYIYYAELEHACELVLSDYVAVLDNTEQYCS